MEEYKDLLKRDGKKESSFQEFFEKNPSFLPGAYGVFGESGHIPYNNSLITQPELHGLNLYKPDFLWIARDSLNVYPVFIEIETPEKKWFTKAGVPTAEFTQAQNQLSEWKSWYSNPVHQNIFYQYYGIQEEIECGKTVSPQYVLIFGSRKEFEGNKELNRRRAQLAREGEVYMTFDRLSPNIKARNAITCNVRNNQYIAKYISPTFRLGPAISEVLSTITNKEEAVSNSEIENNRKKFLLNRLPYWEAFGRKQSRGIINTGDWE